MNVKLNRPGIAKRPGRGLAVSNFSYKVPTSSSSFLFIGTLTTKSGVQINTKSDTSITTK